MPVEHFFGWHDPERLVTRDDFLNRVCEKRGERRPIQGCGEETMLFGKLLRQKRCVDHVVDVLDNVLIRMHSISGSEVCRDLLFT